MAAGWAAVSSKIDPPDSADDLMSHSHKKGKLAFSLPQLAAMSGASSWLL